MGIICEKKKHKLFFFSADLKSDESNECEKRLRGMEAEKTKSDALALMSREKKMRLATISMEKNSTHQIVDTDSDDDDDDDVDTTPTSYA